MKTTILGAMILVAMGMAASGASAEERAPRQASEPVQVVAPGNAASASERRSASRDEFCVRETGTRIRAGAGREGCRFAGRSYTRETLQRTGETDVGRALQRLEPSVRGGNW